MALVGTKDILGIKCEIHASPSGSWQVIAAREEDDEGRGPRSLGHHERFLDAAIADARTTIKKRQRPIEVKFWTFAGEEGVATGLHGRTGAVMASLDGGRKEQISGGYRTTYLRHDTPPEKRQRIIEIDQEATRLAAERRAIVEEYGLDLRSEVERAIESAPDVEHAA